MQVIATSAPYTTAVKWLIDRSETQYDALVKPVFKLSSEDLSREYYIKIKHYTEHQDKQFWLDEISDKQKKIKAINGETGQRIILMAYSKIFSDYIEEIEQFETNMGHILKNLKAL